jgi:hypothetical protein
MFCVERLPYGIGRFPECLALCCQRNHAADLIRLWRKHQ